MIHPHELVEGHVYFLVLYYDRDLKYPKIQTFIYIGKNLLGEEANSAEERWYFQDVKSFINYGIFIHMPKSAEREVFVADEESFRTLYDLKGLIEHLSTIK